MTKIARETKEVLRKKIITLESHLDSMASNWNISMAEHGHTSEKLREKEKEVDSLSKELADANRYANELRDELLVADKENKDLQRQVGGLEDKFEILVDKLLDRVNVGV